MSQATQGDPHGGDSGYSSDEDQEDKGYRPITRDRPRQGMTEPPRMIIVEHGRDGKGDDRGRGVTNILRDFEGQTTFNGFCNEDLQAIADNYEEMAESCEASDFRKLKGMLTRLHCRTRTLLNRQGRDSGAFEEEIQLLGSWYNSAGKQGCLLTEWHGMDQTKALEEQPDESQMAGFRKFDAQLRSVQHQFQMDYHTDLYLGNRLMSAIDVPDMKNALRERTPHSSNQLINLVDDVESTRKAPWDQRRMWLRDGTKTMSKRKDKVIRSRHWERSTAATPKRQLKQYDISRGCSSS